MKRKIFVTAAQIFHLFIETSRKGDESESAKREESEICARLCFLFPLFK